MNIISINFFAFVLFLSFIYNLTLYKHKVSFFFIVSLFFYSIIDYKSSILLILTSYVDYKIALLINLAESQVRKRNLLIASILVNILILFFLKYLQPVGMALVDFLGKEISQEFLNLIQPIGISFYTFKKISYVVDVYRGVIKPEKKLFVFLAYVFFFLEIFSGPIHRAQNLMPQFEISNKISLDDLERAMLFVLIGLFLKLVIADRLAIYTDTIFSEPKAYYGWTFLVAMYFYTFQIYADFAGYTYIIIGLGLLFSVKIPQNFNLPYWSCSISDFWRRWHITLSTWLRDYLYIPLGGNRVSKIRLYANYMIVFLLCGLWHGANITFVIWGGLHGIYLIASNLFCKGFRENGTPKKLFSVLRNVAGIIVTFHLVAVSWIFFRANSLSDATYVLSNLLPNDGRLFVDENTMSYGIVSVSILLIVELVIYFKKLSVDIFLCFNPIMRVAVYYLMIFFIVFASAEKESAFIYVQF